MSAPENDRFLSLIEQMRLLIDEAVASDAEQRRAVAQAALALSPGEIIDLVIGARRERNKHLGKTLFGEPAWDILLELFVAHQKGAAVSLGAAATAGETPSSTGARWIILLEQEGWIERRGHPKDASRNLIGLTAFGVEMMERYATAFADWAANKAWLERK